MDGKALCNTTIYDQIAVLQHVRTSYARRRPRTEDYYATLMNSRTSLGSVVKETDGHRLVIVLKTVTEP